ncbi:ComF family protein [Gracilibacillus sp. YIM 98692]|uniref:ComF family protein n=1 Tax=Gracilibacillus sp. YIM 98692 TaxID=2663532 RepID=UPI0013D801B3|nr:ComF family protein [Gracilibacillus sp. YIM 98692]
MNICYLCDQSIVPTITWENFFHLPIKQTLCEDCKDKLPLLISPFCRRCGRKQEAETLCTDCAKWESHPDYEDVLKWNRAVFTYSPFMQDFITKWKFRGDYIVIDALFSYLLSAFRHAFDGMSHATLVPIPLTKERQHQRAFNQADVLAKQIEKRTNHAVMPVLSRPSVTSSKQSKKSRKERMETANPFSLDQPLQTPAILVDDIYTTGMTIHHAAKTLKDGGCPEVYSFTLIR